MAFIIKPDIYCYNDIVHEQRIRPCIKHLMTAAHAVTLFTSQQTVENINVMTSKQAAGLYIYSYTDDAQIHSDNRNGYTHTHTHTEYFYNSCHHLTLLSGSTRCWRISLGKTDTATFIYSMMEVLFPCVCVCDILAGGRDQLLMSREHSLQVKRIKRFLKVVLESCPSSVTGVRRQLYF